MCACARWQPGGPARTAQWSVTVLRGLLKCVQRSRCVDPRNMAMTPARVPLARPFGFLTSCCLLTSE
eukprot:5210756-Alexandrium_andersonii.AAC.1